MVGRGGGPSSPEFYKSNEIIFKNEGETNHFQTKKLWIFFHARYALQEILKEVLLLFCVFLCRRKRSQGEWMEVMKSND